jgi:hypothetical protein
MVGGTGREGEPGHLWIQLGSGGGAFRFTLPNGTGRYAWGVHSLSGVPSLRLPQGRALRAVGDFVHQRQRPATGASAPTCTRPAQPPPLAAGTDRGLDAVIAGRTLLWTPRHTGSWTP